MRLRCLLPLGLLGLLTGCVAAQLSGNMLGLASTIADLQTSQVLDNLGRFIDDPDAIPAQAVLISGTATVVNTLDPSFAVPLDLASKFVRQLTTSSNTQWSANWNVLPVTDADDLRHLRALYRFAVYGGLAGGKPSPERPGSYDFESDYGTRSDPQSGEWRPAAYTGHESPNARGVVHTGWLFWTDSLGNATPDRPSRPDGKPLFRLGRIGNHVLYTTDRAAWSGFVIAVQGATSVARSWAQHSLGSNLAP